MGVNLEKNIEFWVFQKIVNFASKLGLKLKMMSICVEHFKLKILSEFEINK